MKYAVHPWSHSWPTDKRDPEARVGKMCTFVAVIGRCGRSKLAVWVDVIVSEFGRRTWMPFWVFWMLVSGMSQCTESLPNKCRVAPVSAATLVVLFSFCVMFAMADVYLLVRSEFTLVAKLGKWAGLE